MHRCRQTCMHTHKCSHTHTQAHRQRAGAVGSWGPQHPSPQGPIWAGGGQAGAVADSAPIGREAGARGCHVPPCAILGCTWPWCPCNLSSHRQAGAGSCWTLAGGQRVYCLHRASGAAEPWRCPGGLGGTVLPQPSPAGHAAAEESCPGSDRTARRGLQWSRRRVGFPGVVGGCQHSYCGGAQRPALWGRAAMSAVPGSLEGGHPRTGGT